MSHFDAVTEVPAGFVATASTPDAPVAALEDPQRRIWGVQYHPEVVHTPHGMEVLRRFVRRPRRVRADVDDGLDHRRRRSTRCAPRSVPSRVICALSGGVDSAVAAALVHRAIGHQLTCIYVDTGLMRLDESEQVVETFRRNLGLELIHVDAGDRYFDAPRRRHRAGAEAQDHRRAVRADLRGAHRRADRRRVPRPGHAVPRRHRERRQPTARRR